MMILDSGRRVRDAVPRRGAEPEIESQPWLELRSRLHEPVKGVTDLKMSLYPKERLTMRPARPASVGSIIGTKSELYVVLPWSQAEFDRVWALASSGHLKFTDLCFTSSRYRRSHVVRASFSNELEE